MNNLNSAAVFYRLKIQFKGTNYFGWQKQPKHKTVQGELNAALCSIFKTEMIKTVGSGRTDTGVHSREHIVKVCAPFSIEPEALVRALNSLLPLDIVVLAAESCAQDFLPTNDALSKEYFYLFSNLCRPEVMMSDLMSNTSFDLDMKLMKEACAAFVGTHDFKAFMCAGSDVKTTIRTINFCNIEYFPSSGLHEIVPPHYKVTINGSGFLKQMIRLIVGAIWEVGRGKVEVTRISEELERPSKKRIAPVAPAAGLYKSSVTY